MSPDEWPQGMENEADSVADHEWAHQTRLYRGQHRKVWIPMVGIVLGSAVFLRLDWSPSDAANQLGMAWLLVCALALGASTRSRLSWLVAGTALPASLVLWHLAIIWLGWSLPYHMEPAGIAGPLSLSLLMVPGLLMARLGSWLAHRFRPG
ncbi:hypothetical protein [Deinococcus sp.]|uniref:hypothetical protein n=1 Tax=Deinococcus sp. TaxID=47478 RepID=UPI002869E86B|nr:hypothetical protein [Deinococcus sp.]